MRPVFIGGCDRSGTTLLGALLGTHTGCLCIPEMPFKFGIPRALESEQGDGAKVVQKIASNWRFQIWGLDLDLAEGIPQRWSAREIIEWVVIEYGKQSGKPVPQVWVDHTPLNLRYTQMLLELFPEARIVHIVRDGRAVANSLMRVDWGPNNVESAAHFWVESLARGFAAELMCGPERIIRVRYEDLVWEPAATLEKLCTYVEINYEPGMSQGTGFRVPEYTAHQHSLVGSVPDSSRINSWERELTPRQVEIFESVAADLLLGLGYSLKYGTEAKQISRKERLSSSAYDLYRKSLNWYRARRRIRLGLAHR
jgi:hypothetical protein